MIDQIIRNSGMIDVYVVSEDAKDDRPNAHFPLYLVPHRPLRRYLASFILVLAVTLVGFPLHSFLDPTNLVMLYLLGVVFAAVYLGRGPSIFASFAACLAFDYFFVDPRLSFPVYDTQYLLTFIGLLLVGLIISNSAALLRDQVEALRRREQQTQACSTI